MNESDNNFLLTEQEKEIIELFCIGLKNEQISRRINCSKYVISKSFKSITKKLKAKNKIHAVALYTNNNKFENLSRNFLNFIKRKNQNINHCFTINLTINITLF